MTRSVKVVLTFDDGPHHVKGPDSSNFTMQALAVLRANQAKGAFFVQTHVSHRGGSPRGRDVIVRIHQDGHIVGIHTGSDQDHVSHVKRQESGNLAGDLDRAKKRLTDLGISPEFVRPVGGATNAEVRRIYQEKGLRMVLWDLDSKDTAPGFRPAQIEAHLRRKIAALATRGQPIIVLFHELDVHTRGNIQRYIDAMRQAMPQGYSLEFPRSRVEVAGIFRSRR